MLTVNSEVKKIYGKTEGKVHSKTGVSPIEFNSNNQGLISWSILGNGQQNGTPTPDAPIMPDFVGVRTGNLYFKKITGANISDSGEINTLTGFDLYVAKVEQGVRYSGSGYIYAFFEDEPIIGSISFNGSRVVDSLNNVVSPISGFVAARVSSTAQNIMCNIGSSVLPYEPYGWKIPLTCAGQTTPVYLGQVQTVRQIKKLVLTGEEQYWWSSTYWSNSYVYYDTISTTFPQPISDIGICSHFQQRNGQTLSSGEFNIQFTPALNNRIVIGFEKAGFATLDDFKSYLAAQYAAGTPVTIWYVLAEPETAIVNEPLAKIGDYADELHSENTTVTIPTQNGANTISVDTVVAPSSLTIQYTSPDISEIVRAVDGQGKPLYGPRYGFKIDKSQTDSASAIIYTHDAVTMTPAYMDYANGSFNYGSWGNAWFVKEAKPIALNLDGTIAYYLDPDDYTKKLDGTNSDIFYTLLSVEPSDWSTQWKQYYHLDNGEYVLNDDAEAPTFAANTYYKLETSFTGNFMVQFPKVYFKRYEDANYNYVEVSDRKLSRDFKAYAHLNANGDELDFIYFPMFKGVIQSSKLRSIPGVIPQGGTTASTEVTAAEACGTGWQIWDHSSREMINDLLVLMSKNADGQAKFGKGRESGYNASDTVTYGKLQTGTLIKKGAFYGYSTSYSDVKVFHIEGPWANRWERFQGLLLVNGAYKIKMAPPYNFTGTDFVTLTTASPASNNYLRTLATSEYGSVTATVSTYASSPFKDYFYQSQSGTRVGIVGGSCHDGSLCGPRCVLLNSSASSSYWDVGASAIYKPST